MKEDKPIEIKKGDLTIGHTSFQPFQNNIFFDNEAEVEIQNLKSAIRKLEETLEKILKQKEKGDGRDTTRDN